jgi:hypothetical protein
MVYKIKVIDDNGSIKVEEWLDKKTWREIIDILSIQDFNWYGNGKESCWIKAIA